MMKVKYYTCPVCKQKYKTLSGWGDHMDKIHPKERPEGYSTSRFFYMIKTGKTAGKCRTCKGPTPWNESSMKYAQFCSNPNCKEAYVKIAKSRMRNVYGKEYILDDPNIQKKMMSHRKISGVYTFSDGGKIEYVGSYERNFLMMLDTLLAWPSNDIIGPSPHVYYYDYENSEYDKDHEGRKFYIPDYYIPSLNLEIEIKQQTSTNQEFNKINRVKEKLKDEVMAKNPKVNYLKINDNDFREFFTYLENAKLQDPTETEKVMESCMINTDFSNDEIAMEACRNVDEARKFIKEVDKSAKKYGANYFIVTDGASKTSNGINGKNPTSNPAVKNARDTQVQWEKENGFDPDEDWKKGTESTICECINGCDYLENGGNCEGCENIIATESLSKPKEIELIEKYYKAHNIKSGISKSGDRGLDAYISGKSNSLFILCNSEYKKIAKDLKKLVGSNFSIQEDNYNTLFLKRKNSIAIEEANYSKKNRYPVFIVLQHSDIFTSRVIRKFTHADFSHACISFNSKLTPLYTFGPKSAETPIGNLGFSMQEDGPLNGLYLGKPTMYNVYVMYVDKKAIDAMKLKLQYFIDNKDFLKYDMINLISVWRQIPSEWSKRWFCSRFVAEIIGAGRPLDKYASLHRPEDFMGFSDITLVNHGSDFKKYNYRITEMNMRKVRQSKFDEIKVANEATVVENTAAGTYVYPSEYEITNLRYGGGKNGTLCVVGITDRLRYRAEIMIVKDGKLFINIRDDTELRYTFPGGGVNLHEDPRDTALREAQEEVRMNVANVKYGGTYVKIFSEEKVKKSWKKHNVEKADQYTGSYSVVFIGTYFSNYDGDIAKEDQSNMIKTGKFIDIAEVYDLLDPIHQEILDKYFDGGLKSVNPIVMESTSYIQTKDSILPAMEGILIPSFFKRDKSENSHESWARKIFASSSKELLGRSKKRKGFQMIIKDGKFEFHGLNIRTLYNRIKKFYSDRSIYELFIPEYNKFDLNRFNKKKISRSQMRVEYLKVDQFFAIELVCLFNDLGERFKDNGYKHIAKMIYNDSWLSEADRKAEDTPLLSTKNLKNIDLTLNDYQQDFIEKYPKLKAQLHLKGYILAFEQGLGKTLTAISLAECLDADHVYIVCPNSLKANWALEIKKYYKKYQQDEDLWRQEVFICSDRPSLFSEHTTKFMITNNESIEKMFPYIMDGKNVLILDESHNFRNINSKRVGQLIDLRDRLKCTDSLIMSGTPIKATPDEIVPALMMIDPTFSIEAAKTFSKAFKLKSSLGTSLVQTRFSKIMFRKEKDVLGDSLPQKFVHNLPLRITESDKYLMTSVNEAVQKRFSAIYEEGYHDIKKLEPEFFEMSRRYVPAGYTFAEFRRIMNIVVNKDGDVHELDKEYAENYMAKAKENIRDKATRDRYDYLIKHYARYRAHCLGLAFGEILPPYRRDMFISLYQDNRNFIMKMILDNVKKTLIFTQFKGVALYIHKDLNENGIQAGLITGEVKDRLSVLKDFKENDQTEVLVATSQTIGTGVTLTEANQMFFFGPPWRDGDFQQCSDRIHRIGQTDDCHIYMVTLDTGESLNLSTRMDNILAWSKQMTEAVIKSTDDKENLDETHFEELLKASESVLIPEFLSEPEDSQLNVLRRLPGLRFLDLVTEQFTYNYREYRAKRIIPENTIIMESSTSLEARELLESANYASAAIPNVEFKELHNGNGPYMGLVTTRPIRVGELIRLPKKE